MGAFAQLRAAQASRLAMPLARRRLPGLMQDDKPLLIQNIIDHAARVHGTREITSRWCSDDAATARTTYGEARLRAGALAAALTKDPRLRPRRPRRVALF